MNKNQKRALDALLTSPSVAAAARACGLGQRTLWRYLSDPEFAQALTARQDLESKALAAALAGLSGAALETLVDLLEDKDVPPSVRARVALGWLRERRDAIELDSLIQRIGKLEEGLNGS